MKDINQKRLKEIIENHKLVLIDFWSSWCPPCKMIERLLDELDAKYSGQIEMVKINTDRNPGINKKFNIMGLPTIIILEKAREVERSVGSKTKREIDDMIKRTLSE